MTPLIRKVARSTTSKHPLDRRRLVVELRPANDDEKETIAIKPLKCRQDAWVSTNINDLYTTMLRWRAERIRREKAKNRKKKKSP